VGQVEVLEGSFAAPSLDKISLKIREGYERLETQDLENQNLIHKNVKVRVAVGKIAAEEVRLRTRTRRHTMKPLLLILMLSSTVAAAGQFESLGQPCRAFNVLASRVITIRKAKSGSSSPTPTKPPASS
jgi:hypothetical protein